jgi:hypothetical protein
LECAGTPAEEAVLAEVIAAGMQNLIERADANKLQRARERLSAARSGQGRRTAATN